MTPELPAPAPVLGTHDNTSQTPTYKVLPPPIQGHLDWRQFRALRLAPNGVTVLLVSDAHSPTMAAAARVATGAAADPRSLPGLAHFCEHMCFYGSAQYPAENEYKAYLAAHGGRSNASTSLYATTYFFEVVPGNDNIAAQGALDRFVSFFVQPLFPPDGTGREINAVDSENSKNLTNDSRRRLQILKELCHPAHYVSKFTTGNHTTLPTTTQAELTTLRQALLAFHAYHYHPENLTVVLAGPQSLDTLEQWAVSRWSAMTNNRSAFTTAFDTKIQTLIQTAAQEAPPSHHAGAETPPPFHPPLRTAAQLWADETLKGPLVVTMQPLRPLRQLVLFWNVPAVLHIPDTSPLSVLAHLLGHEGPGSVFATLQNQGYLTTLSAGPRLSAPDFAIFQVSIQLTAAGEEHWSAVVRTVMTYLQILGHSLDAAAADPKNSQDWQRIWAEKTQLANLHFEYQSTPGSVYNYAAALTHAVFQYGTRDCLKAGAMLSTTQNEKDKESNSMNLPLQQIQDSVHRLLRPENLVIERCSQAAWEEAERKLAVSSSETTTTTLPRLEKRTDPWYGVDYFLGTVDPNDEHWQDLWQIPNELPALDPSKSSLSLHLPRPNVYLPRTLDLCSDLPEQVRQDAKPCIDTEISPPQLLIDDNQRGRLWHRLDDRYAQPKASITLHITNAAVQNVPSTTTTLWEYSVHAYVKSAVLSSMFNQALAQETYDADLAGLHWNVSLMTSGIRFSYSGFHDRLPDLSHDVLKAFLLMKNDHQTNGAEETTWIQQERFFSSAKDKLLRNLKTFFSSRRADAHANYYRDLLLEDQHINVHDSIQAAEAISLNDIVAHHETLVQNTAISLDCQVMGNLSKNQAISLFFDTTDLWIEARKGKALMDSSMWRPGSSEGRLSPGRDLELHFASENPQEENGAVVMTFQSPNPGYIGPTLSSAASLEHTATLRLLSQILREPMFNQLRTKQTLGYIVSTYFESGNSSRPASLQHLGPSNVPVDALTVVVLSRKVSPPEVAERIDTFLDEFRVTLANLPESEIKSHAQSLSAKLLKPIQKLSTEAATQFGKINRYAAQILSHGGSPDDIPWNPIATKELSTTLLSLNRSHLLKLWDEMLGRGSRARIVSCVYGTTYPLEGHFRQVSPDSTVLTDVADIVSLRKQLPAYDNQISSKEVESAAGTSIWAGMPRIANDAPKVVLVTGASSGIGQATAEEYLDGGHIVYGAARRTERLTYLDVHDRGHAICLDVTVKDDMEAIVEKIFREQGRIDVVVHAAGFATVGPVEALPLADAKRNFDVNYWAVVHLTQRVLPYMRQAGGGTLVVISSVMGQTYVPFASAYVATKHALEGWANALRVELQPFGIKVVVIQPGFCATEFKQVALQENKDGSTAVLPGLEAASPYHTRLCNVIGLLNFTERWWTSSRVVARRIVHASQTQRQSRLVTGWLGRPLLWMQSWAGPRVMGVLYSLAMQIPWSRLGKQTTALRHLPTWKKTYK